MKYLIAVDSSDNSKFAFRYAKKCFFTEHDHVYILTVAETPTTYPFEDMLNFNNNIYEEMNQKIDQMYSDMLKRYGRKLTRAKIPHTCLIAKGSIKDVICRQAQDLTVDVVVMGRRGLGKLERTFIGSTSQYCVHNLGCSVMVIPETAMKNLSPSSSDEELQSQQMAEMENRVGKETQKAEGSPFVDNPYERAQERIGKGECGHPECGTDECRRVGKKEWKGEKGECGHPECGSGECKRGEMKSKKEHKEKGGKDIKKGPKEESKHEGVGKKEKAGKQEWAGEKGECGHPECGTDECKRGEIKEGGKQEWSGDKSKEKHGSEKKERQGESKKGAKQDRSGKKGEWTGEKGQQIGKGECGHPECGTDECRRVGKKEWKGEKGECGHPECGTDECRRVGKKEWKGQKGECGHPECGSGECKRGEMKSKKEHKEKGEKEKGLELPGGKSYAGVVAASKDKPSPELSLKQAKEEMSKYEGKKEEKSEQQMEAPAQKL